MAGLSAALYVGSCSGHGRCIPTAVHSTVPCGTPCPGVPPRPVASLDGQLLWPPFPQRPLSIMSSVFNVIVSGQVPIVDQDLLTNHPGACTNLVKFSGCDPTPAAMPCPAANLATEDVAGGGAHVRKAFATTKSVFINGRRACRVADPLGPPCLSLIATGSPNVFIGV